ncbi:hypothetical protein V6N13_064771 [Hibiscus sabdariffa]
MGGIMVSAMLIFCSVALVNCNRGIRDTTGWGECSASDFWEQANMALTSLDTDTNSTAIALSEIKQTAGWGRCSDCFVDFSFPCSSQQEDYGNSGGQYLRLDVFKVGVAVNSNITRFPIDVFEATVRLLPYEITYKLISFDGLSDELIDKVTRETYDVAIGDMVTTRSRDQHVELSPSYLEPGFMMTNSVIGCDGRSQTIWYLVKVLGFNRRNVKIIASFADYKEALDSGSIKAAFLLTPYAKILFAKYCHDFIEINPTYGNNPEGYRFVFPKGSLLANGIAYAILKLERNGELQHMEDQISASFKCSRKPVEDATIQNVGVGSFMGVFVLFGELHIVEKQEEFRRCGVDIK